MNGFISIYMRITLMAANFGRTCAARNKRENAILVAKIAESRYPIDGS
jgi:hypothetical protein